MLCCSKNKNVVAKFVDWAGGGLSNPFYYENRKKNIKNEFDKDNILNNPEFQSRFKSFYRMNSAGLSNSQKKCFFELLLDKQEDLKYILSELYKIPRLDGKHSIQFSFATKLLHTIDNDKPIFDSGVETLTGVKRKGSDRDTKINSCIEIYNSLGTLYAELKDNDKIRKIISKFRSKFKVDDEKMSDTKVLDFIMWSLGKLRNKNKTAHNNE